MAVRYVQEAETVPQPRSKMKILRQAKGLSIPSIAAKVGCSRWYIYKIEEGARTPSVAVAARIARVLGTTIDFLFREDEKSA